MYLFKIEDSFLVTGMGLILVPVAGDKAAKVGDAIKIVRPDQTIIVTTIKGIGWNNLHGILVGSNLTKEDVPIGSEIWLNNA